MLEIAKSFGHVFAMMAPWLVFGFLMAGVIAVWIPRNWVNRMMGGRSGFGGVLRAVAIGVPLPICSCGVLPIATGLRKHGAGKGPTAALLVSTPQTGIDSILATYALMGPVFAVARPVAAALTGIVGGVVVAAVGGEDAESTAVEDAPVGSRGIKAVFWQAYRRLLGSVVDMEVDQPVLPGQDERHVFFTRGFGVADVPGEAEAGAFQEEIHGFVLIGAEAVRVLHGDADRRAADPFRAQVTEAAAGIQVAVQVPVVHLHLPVRQGDVDAVVHVHVHRQGPGAAETVPQGQELFCHLHGTPDGLQVRVRNQAVEVRDVQVFVQVDRIVNPGLLRQAQQAAGILQAVRLVLREIHVQLDETEAKAGAQGDILLQGPVLDQGRHSELHLQIPLLSVLLSLCLFSAPVSTFAPLRRPWKRMTTISCGRYFQRSGYEPYFLMKISVTKKFF